MFLKALVSSGTAQIDWPPDGRDLRDLLAAAAADVAPVAGVALVADVALAADVAPAAGVAPAADVLGVASVVSVSGQKRRFPR